MTASRPHCLHRQQARLAHPRQALALRQIEHCPSSQGVLREGVWTETPPPFAPSTIDTEIKADRNNIIIKLITFRIAKAKVKAKLGVKYLWHRFYVNINAKDRLSQLNINATAKAK